MQADKLELKELNAVEETPSAAPNSDWIIRRPKRAKLTAEESLKRMQAFESERKEQFIAAVRKSKPNHIIYRDAITRWFPPYEDESISDTEKNRIIEKVGRFIEYYGESFSVK